MCSLLPGVFVSVLEALRHNFGEVTFGDDDDNKGLCVRHAHTLGTMVHIRVRAWLSLSPLVNNY